MKFWKFEYEGDQHLRNCIESRTLAAPPQDIVSGRARTEAQVFKAIGVGDGVILATLVGSEAQIHAVGTVQKAGSRTQAPTFTWVKTRKTMFPELQGDLLEWRQKTAFEIPAEKAQAYGLKDIVAYFAQGNGQPG